MRTRKRSRATVDLAIFAALFFGLYSPYIFTAKDFPAGIDTPIFTQPTATFTAKSLAQGVVPLWNPYWFSGFPHLAAPRMGVLYPATLLYALDDFEIALKIDTLCHVFLMGLSAFLLGQNLFRSRIAAHGFSFLMISGALLYTIFFHGHIFALHTIAYMPISLWLIRKILETRQWKWAIALTVTTMLQFFGGDMQILSYILLANALFTLAALAYLYRTSSPGSRMYLVLKAGGFCLAGVVVGSLCAAVQIIPTWELIGQSIRSEPVSESFLAASAFTLSMYWKDLLQLDMHTGQFTHYLPFVGGALAPSLFLVAFRDGKQPMKFVFLALLVFSVVYTLMPDGLIRSAIMNTPVLNKGRLPFRMQFLVAVFYYVIVGFGICSLIRWTDAGGRMRLLQPYSFVALSTVVLAAVQRYNSPAMKHVLAFEVFAVVALAGAVAFMPGTLRWAGWCLLAALVLEGTHYFHHRLHPYSPFSAPETSYAVDEDFRSFSEQRSGHDRVALFSPGLWDRPLRQASTMLTEDRNLGGYHGLLLNRTVDFFRTTAGLEMLVRDDDGKLIREDPIAYSQDWVNPRSYAALDMLNVRYLVSKGMVLATPEGSAAREARFVLRSEAPIRVYENMRACPVAYVVHDVRRVENDEAALRLIGAGEIDPCETAVLTESFDDRVVSPAAGVEEVDVVRYGINGVELIVRSTGPGLLVLTDTYYPGWRATVDGKRAHVYRVNTLVRGVIVDAGVHNVRFSFLPMSVIVGLAVSLAALTLVLVSSTYMTVQSWRRRSQPHGEVNASAA